MEVFSSGAAFSISGAGLFNDELKIPTGLGDEQGLSPAAREAAVIEKALMEVIVERGVSGWGCRFPR